MAVYFTLPASLIHENKLEFYSKVLPKVVRLDIAVSHSNIY